VEIVSCRIRAWLREPGRHLHTPVSSPCIYLELSISPSQVFVLKTEHRPWISRSRQGPPSIAPPCRKRGVSPADSIRYHTAYHDGKPRRPAAARADPTCRRLDPSRALHAPSLSLHAPYIRLACLDRSPPSTALFSAFNDIVTHLTQAPSRHITTTPSGNCRDPLTRSYSTRFVFNGQNRAGPFG
jgi:hypothetical protein